MEGEETTTTPAAPAAPVTPETPAKKATPWWAYAVSVVVVVAIILGVVYVMESQGRLQTGWFVNEARATIATVNGVAIKGGDLTTSINQISATAQLQGIDITDPQVQANIRTQAVDMLVNTELLKQEADKRGIVITDEDVQARIDQLITEVGTQELLNERMASLGIDDITLRRDVKIELMIQTLLDQVFADKDLTITEEEVLGVYESAGGAAAGLPALEEVRAQVEAQVRAGKEQVIVDEFISSLRGGATIEVK